MVDATSSEDFASFYAVRNDHSVYCVSEKMDSHIYLTYSCKRLICLRGTARPPPVSVENLVMTVDNESMKSSPTATVTLIQK